MIISIIVAMAKNRAIGINNKLPWDMPADLKYFHDNTIGKPVIMGQKTFESIGRILPDRTNIVLTLDKGFSFPGVKVAYSIEEAIGIAKDTGAQEAMICGGASIYRQFLPLSDRLYLTIIDTEIDGDAFFPEIDFNKWKEVKKIENKKDKENKFNYTFLVLERG